MREGGGVASLELGSPEPTPLEPFAEASVVRTHGEETHDQEAEGKAEEQADDEQHGGALCTRRATFPHASPLGRSAGTRLDVRPGA